MASGPGAEVRPGPAEVRPAGGPAGARSHKLPVAGRGQYGTESADFPRADTGAVAAAGRAGQAQWVSSGVCILILISGRSRKGVHLKDTAKALSFKRNAAVS